MRTPKEATLARVSKGMLLTHMMSHEYHMIATPPTACHISCKLTCTGPGADKCTECKDGYAMENDSCTGE